jgi:amidase
VPAHWCGLFGLKPTEGRVPNTGHIPEVPGTPHALRHMNTLGPLARSVDDLATILKVIAGPDDHDWETAPAPLDDVPAPRLSSLKFSWCTKFAGEMPSRETTQAIAGFMKKLADLGAHVEERSPVGFSFDEAWETWGEIVIAERVVTQGEAARERARSCMHRSATCRARGGRGAGASVANGRAHPARQAHHRAGGILRGLRRLALPVAYGPAIGHVPFGKPVEVDERKVPTSSPPPLLPARST